VDLPNMFAKIFKRHDVPFPLQIAPLHFGSSSINVSRAGIIDSPPSSENVFAPHI
jgi:hypothetical protein